MSQQYTPTQGQQPGGAQAMQGQQWQQAAPTDQQGTMVQGGMSQGTMAQGAGGAGQLYPTRNFLSEDVRQNSIAILNRSLADATVLYSQLKTAHWNVKGMHFFQLHELFDELAETIEDHVDAIAERATALGGEARGTVRLAAQESTLPELPPSVTDGRQLLERIAQNLSALDAQLFEGIRTVAEQDPDTADLLNEVSRDVTEALWFVEAHLQGAGGGGGQMQFQQQLPNTTQSM